MAVRELPGANAGSGASTGSVPVSAPSAPGFLYVLYGACALLGALLVLAVGFPAPALQAAGLYLVLAFIAGALFGVAVPDAFERDPSFVAGLFGERGRSVGRLVAAAGYRRARPTHSLGGLICFGLLLCPAPFFFGTLVGGGFAGGALLGYAVHLICELALTSPDTTSPDTTSPDTTSPDTTSPDTTSPDTTAEPQGKADEQRGREDGIALLWPLWRRRLSGLDLFPTSGWARVALYLAMVVAAGVAATVVARTTAVTSTEALVRQISTLPDEVVDFFTAHPVGLGGIPFYGLLLWAGATLVMPRVYGRVAVAARDDASRRYTGGLECYALKPYGDASFDPRRFARVLEELPLGDENQLYLGYQINEQVRTVIGGRGIWEAAAAVDAAYGDLTLVPLGDAEAWTLPPDATNGNDDGANEGANEDLVPVVVRYEVDGELAELGLRSLSDFDLRDTDPLSGPLTGLQQALSPKDGERAMLVAHVREAATESGKSGKGGASDGAPVFLTRALAHREDQDRAEEQEKKRAEDDAWREKDEEKTRRYEKARGQSRTGSGSRRAGTWEDEANEVIEAAAGGLIRAVVFLLLLGPRLCGKLLKVLFGRRGRGDRGMAGGVPEAGAKERRVEERRTIVERLAGRSFCVVFSGVAYVKAGPDVESRTRRVQAAYERYFATFGRRGAGASYTRTTRGSSKSAGKKPSGGAEGKAASGSSPRNDSTALVAGEVELRLGPPFMGAAVDGPVVTNEELAALFHPLGKEVEVHGREVGSVLAIPPPPAMTTVKRSSERSGALQTNGSGRRSNSIQVAHSNHASYADTPIELTFDELRTHGGITGGTGYGKSSLQYRIIESAWEQGLGMALLDPKMDFFACVVSNLPARRLEQAIVVDAGHEAPVPAYNLLVCPEKVDTTQRAATLLEGLKKRFPANAFQGRNSNYFMMSFRAMIGANMARISAGDKPVYVLPDLATGRFLAPSEDTSGERPYFRAEVLEHIANDPEFEDVMAFFDDFDKLKSATQQEHVQSVTNKIGPLAGTQVRRFLGAPAQDFDLRTAIDEGLGIFLNLSKHVFPGGAAALVGTLFFSDIIAAAKARHWEATMRGTQDSMRDFVIAVDEVQNFTCPEMVEILAEARAYRTPIWYGHQYAAQIKDEELREAMAQAATHGYFNQTPKDAAGVAPILGDPFTKERLTNMPKYNFVIKAGEKIATCQTIPLPPTDPSRANEVRLASSARYASGEWAPELALPNAPSEAVPGEEVTEEPEFAAEYLEPEDYIEPDDTDYECGPESSPAGLPETRVGVRSSRQEGEAPGEVAAEVAELYGSNVVPLRRRRATIAPPTTPSTTPQTPQTPQTPEAPVAEPVAEAEAHNDNAAAVGEHFSLQNEEDREPADDGLEENPTDWRLR